MKIEKPEDGDSTRRAVVVSSEEPLSKEELINRINSKTTWKAKPSEYHDVLVQQGDLQVELKQLGDRTFKSVNVFPQDLEHRYVPIEQDVLSALAPVLETLDTTVAWILADKDKIKTEK